MIILLAVAAWLTVSVLMVAICRVAFRGDLALMAAAKPGFRDVSASEQRARRSAAA
jgi:hypothetical protein